MTSTQTDLESMLCACYRRQAHCYRQALGLAERIQSAMQAGQNPQPELQAMALAMKEISDIEAEIKQAKHDWSQAGETPGPQLQTVLKEVADLIQELLARIDQAEKHAQLQVDRLAPQLDHMIRSQQMRRAYSGNTARRRGA